MRLLLVFIFIFTCSFAADFISALEYGRMLYQNPRGIGCDKCHGLKGEGKIIAKYTYKNEDKKIVAPPINNISQKVFLDSLSKKSKVMPKYFLTKSEIKNLFDYIQSAN